MSSANSNLNVIIDTGCANLSSVKFAIERIGLKALITDDIAIIKSADKVILPGVGNAKHAMANIHKKDLTPTLQALTQPVLGFCLGMQLMTTSSHEGNFTGDLEIIDCLNLIPTQVKPLQAQGLRLPHMGWNTLTSVIDHPVFQGISKNEYFYFVHNFAVPVSEFTAATCQYGNTVANNK